MNTQSLKLPPQVKALVHRVDGMSVRERGVLAATVFVATVVIFLELSWAPQMNRLDRLQKELTTASADREILSITLDKLQREVERDPDDAIRAENARLAEQLAAVLNARVITGKTNLRLEHKVGNVTTFPDEECVALRWFVLRRLAENGTVFD